MNLAQGFKEPIVYYQQGKDSKQIKPPAKRSTTSVTPSDCLPAFGEEGELLRFGKPTTGSELCTAVEMMYSLETILEVTGDMQWADYLSAWHTTPCPAVTDDYSARQYYQQTNRSPSPASGGSSPPRTTTPTCFFGELTGYPCCTSIFTKGWPKFVRTCGTRLPTTDSPPALRPLASNGTSGRRNRGEPEREETAYPFEGDSTLPCFVYGQESEKGLLPSTCAYRAGASNRWSSSTANR